MSQAVENYGITESKLVGLVCTRHGLSQLLKYGYFQVLDEHNVIKKT